MTTQQDDTIHPFFRRLDRIANWITDHWLLCFNAFVGLYVALPILAPFFMHFGLERPAQVIYTVYKPACHQMAFRSVFFFGDQPFYPRELAGTEWQSFESYASRNPAFANASLDGLDYSLITSARHFVGDAEMGFKTAICQRDLGIFFFLFVGGLLYAFLRTRMRIRPMPFLLFIILGMGPIGLDGFSQLFGYYGETISWLSMFPVRESPPLIRSLTGAWFGFCVAWLVLPYIDGAGPPPKQKTAST